MLARKEASSRMPQGILALEGLAVIKNCHSLSDVQGQTYLDSHVVLLVLHGAFRLTMGTHHTEVRENELAFLPRNSAIDYRKFGDPGQHHRLEYWMFFITDDLLSEFAGKFPVPLSPKENGFPDPKPANQRLVKYLESLEPYFNEPETVAEELIRLKILELLFDLSSVDAELVGQLFDRRRPSGRTFAELMEKNVDTGLSLAELADLAGRSLSSFQRDFKAVFQTTPSRWFRDQRIRHAQDLLQRTNFSVTEIGLKVGFESPAHFSRLFHQKTGRTPLEFRQSATRLAVDTNRQRD